MSRTHFACALLLVSVFCSAALSQEVGDQVIVLRATPLKVGDKNVQNILPGRFAEVQAVDGEWLWVSPESTGWVCRRDVALPAPAIAFFSERIQTNPRDVSAYVARANAKLFDKQCDDAIQDYDNALRLDRGNVSALTFRGIAHAALGLNQKALADLAEALRLDPRAIDALYFRGSFLADKGQSERAIADLTQCIHLSPNHAAAYRNRAGAWGDVKEFGKMMADSNRAIQLNRKDRVVFHKRTFYLLQQGRNDDALADANQAIRLRADAEGFNNRGYTYAKMHRFDEALADYKTALDQEPKYLRPRVNRIELLLEQSQFADALDDLAEVLRLDADSTYALQQRARLLAACPDPRFRDAKQAVADGTRLCELAQWNNSEPLSVLAAAYGESGDFRKAVEWQTKALQFATDKERRTVLTKRLKSYEEGKPYRIEVPYRTVWSDEYGVIPVEARESEISARSGTR